MACCSSCAMSRTDQCSSIKGLCAPTSDLYTTAATEKVQMQELNNVLASYLDRIRGLKNRDGGHLDPQAYKEAMRALEEELINVKNLYERELARLRNLVEEANKDKSKLLVNVESCHNMATGLKSRLDLEASGNKKVLQDIAGLQRLLAEKEKEVASLRGCLNSCQSELNVVGPQLSQAHQDCEGLRKRLEAEQSLRIAAEVKLKQLCDRLDFDSAAMGQENRDLKERLKTCNDIISSLENKINQLSRGTDASTAGLLQKLREGTNAELKRYKDEAERTLGNVIQEMGRQRDDDRRTKECLMKENQQLQELVNKLKGKIADLEGQLGACYQQKRTLDSTLNCEREVCRKQISGLERTVACINDEVLAKVNDVNRAKEAQVSLQAEINTYKTLLDQGKNTSLPEIKHTSSTTWCNPGPITNRYDHYKAPSKTELNAIRGSNRPAGCSNSYSYLSPAGNAATSSIGNTYNRNKCQSNYMTYIPPDMKLMNRHSYPSFR